LIHSVARCEQNLTLLFDTAYYATINLTGKTSLGKKEKNWITTKVLQSGIVFWPIKISLNYFKLGVVGKPINDVMLEEDCFSTLRG